MPLLGKPLDYCKAGVVQDAQYKMTFLKIKYIEEIVHFVHLTSINLLIKIWFILLSIEKDENLWSYELNVSSLLLFFQKYCKTSVYFCITM
jgi:hypothetical protein